MPILCLDKYGNLIESSPDNSDGTGAKGPTPTGENFGDVCFGNDARQVADSIVNGWNRDAKAQAIYDRKAEVVAQHQRQLNQRRKAASHQLAELLNTEAVKNKMIKAGLMQGAIHPADFGTAISGMGMTANGQLGYAGMGKEQQAVYDIYNNRHGNIQKVSGLERAQKALEKLSYQQQHDSARRAALMSPAPSRRRRKTHVS